MTEKLNTTTAADEIEIEKLIDGFKKIGRYFLDQGLTALEVAEVQLETLIEAEIEDAEQWLQIVQTGIESNRHKIIRIARFRRIQELRKFIASRQ